MFTSTKIQEQVIVYKRFFNMYNRYQKPYQNT